MKIVITATVNPTEDEPLVRGAIEALFPSIEVHCDGETMRGEGADLGDLETLKTAIASQAIRDTARSSLRANSFGSATTLYLNKQAAAMGKVNIAKDGPLGPIVVRITGDVQSIIDYLAPSTIE
jgi:predicted RNA binding protein with dsRBD fold (UPF0201 family)